MKEGEIMRDRGWRRFNDRNKALRKQKINYYWRSTYDGELWWYYNNLHQYSKNKIHCSCGRCIAKTRNKNYKRRHIHGNYAPAVNYSICDKRKILSMTEDEQKFDFYGQKCYNKNIR